MWPDAMLIFAAAMIFTYAGYPALAWLLSKILPRPLRRAPYRPPITVILPVHNERRRLDAKLRNIIAQGYPRALTEIIVVDDGSDVEVARTLAPDLLRRITLITFPRRRGKASALNAGVHGASGEILVFTDARQDLKAGSIESLLKNFYDRRVTAVTGALEERARGADGAFRRYEEMLRRWESKWSSPAGATGALYAVRRKHAIFLPESTILDDLVMSMAAAAKGRLVYEPRAVAVEAGEGRGDTWRRRLRTLAGNWQIVFHPLRYRRIFSAGTSFQLICHKMLRLLFPLFTLGLAVSLALSIPALALAAAAGIALCLAVLLFGRGRLIRAASGAAASLIAAPLAGLAGYISGRETVLWARRSPRHTPLRLS